MQPDKPLPIIDLELSQKILGYNKENAQKMLTMFIESLPESKQREFGNSPVNEANPGLI